MTRESTSSAVPWVCFRVSGGDYAIRLGAVVEVMAGRAPELIPLLPLAVGGILNARGEPLAVVDGGTLLGEKPSGSHHHVLVLERGNRRAGILVDHVLRIDRDLERRLAELGRSAADAPAEAVSHWIEKRYTREGVAIGLVDSEALFERAMDLLAGAGSHRRDERCQSAF
jgi:chemotaxis signal transduction protein